MKRKRIEKLDELWIFVAISSLDFDYFREEIRRSLFTLCLTHRTRAIDYSITFRGWRASENVEICFVVTVKMRIWRISPTISEVLCGKMKKSWNFYSLYSLIKMAGWSDNFFLFPSFVKLSRQRLNFITVKFDNFSPSPQIRFTIIFLRTAKCQLMLDIIIKHDPNSSLTLFH